MAVAEEKGTISIHTENIFPIIKRFLYSDHEIFLRELVSNAVDATQKLKKLAAIGEFNGELGDLKITVSLDEAAKTITVRDQSGRWGSCSSAGKLSFNWRLVLAPPFVLDYVAAHEVAHRIEMNHSPAFWATVARTLPDMAAARAWLKTNGGALMGYGRAP